MQLKYHTSKQIEGNYKDKSLKIAFDINLSLIFLITFHLIHTLK